MRRSLSHENGSERMEGSVERVTFHSEETGFCVLRVEQPGRKGLVTVVGHVPQVVPGEWIAAQGAWVNDREHGRQFKAASLRTLPPDSIEGIRRFLGSGLIRGIGPVYAGKLVDTFGKDIFEVIEKESARLESVEGIGRVRRRQIKESWNETRSVRAIMAFLLSHGVSTARAFRIHKTYGDQAITRVREDPYCLARDIRGIGFKLADQVAEKLDIGRESALRARAGVEHVLLEVTGEGHCAYPREGLVGRAGEVLGIRREIIEDAVDHGLETRRLVEEEQEGERLLFLAPLHQAECAVAALLTRLTRGAHPCPAIDTVKALAWCEQRIRLPLAPCQREAVELALRSKVMILTGGPGVGKTTLVNAILRILRAKRLSVQLCAPTGRAAKRLSETTGCPARTIHRLLAFDPQKSRFRHDERHPLAGDYFVVDETSMIDLPLAAHLLRALPSHAALLLVGDVDQLPSVGPGMVLRDIIDSGVFPVCRLTQVFRQAARSRIVTNAHRIHAGQLPLPGEKGGDDDFFFVPEDDPERAAERIANLVTRTLPSRRGFDPMEDIQVLSPMRRGALGSEHLNALLQQRLNPSGEAVERFGTVFRTGDKVMQLENNYDKEVFNGDIGRIAHIDAQEREMVVVFDGRRVPYDLQELDELAPSYAITVHKSQGSEYPCVVIPVHTQHYVMLQRNLLYTAVTRGRKLVLLVGSQRALAIAVGRQDARQRITTLRRRLLAAAAHQPARWE